MLQESDTLTQSQEYNRDSENLFPGYLLVSPESESGARVSVVGARQASTHAKPKKPMDRILWLLITSDTGFSVLSAFLMTKDDSRTHFLNKY